MRLRTLDNPCLGLAGTGEIERSQYVVPEKVSPSGKRVSVPQQLEPGKVSRFKQGSEGSHAHILLDHDLPTLLKRRKRFARLELQGKLDRPTIRSLNYELREVGWYRPFCEVVFDLPPIDQDLRP
jgi:hypothetical protein